ncbi:Phosphoribosylaminoimidazole-succinocarboxamide synthase [Desulfovibrio sp. X2]|uniref:phosphoribosylaminoimidazolesuccinocarboxamide synthase n=1 Tax=Desulfovibrio sp. X2 TaxID=941449 RepID=UPI000358C3C5|nr:phosphoribosylaminoimidazolesuccinocarboxamide synthase [Desulfovibrio sp. X2]EPR37420.1 Phosphoribosylaminoimidazole-succinocarboxamide synthase [Desulfovibrio sp. X2]
MKIVSKTNIPEYPLLSRGKVRDIYAVGDDELLIVTTDRLSAFDVILPDAIPFKGAVLNQITLFWMERFKDLVPNHVVADRIELFPENLRAYADELEGRSVIVKKASPLPIECIVRGYITGSGWKDYKKTGKVSGHALPEGLLESQELPEPLFTPSTKAEIGAHDENITVDRAGELIGGDVLREVERISLEIYRQARNYARNCGIIIADTKFEFGIKGGQLLWIDEALTPDSSRFWPMDGYEPGHGQPSFDKQFVRDYLEEIGFNKQPPAPHLPPELVEKTSRTYMRIFEMLTGSKLKV